MFNERTDKELKEEAKKILESYDGSLTDLDDKLFDTQTKSINAIEPVLHKHENYIDTLFIPELQKQIDILYTQDPATAQRKADLLRNFFEKAIMPKLQNLIDTLPK